MENWTIVYKGKDVLRAEIIKGELMNNEIEAVVINKKDSIYPMLNGISEVRVMPENQLKAEKIIEKLND